MREGISRWWGRRKIYPFSQRAGKWQITRAKEEAWRESEHAHMHEGTTSET